MEKENIEIILKEDGVYQVTMLFPKERFSSLLRESFGHADNLAHQVTKVFADRFVEYNYDQLVKLIDMDVIKLLATRRISKIAAD